jgi:hypothetical protein
MIALLLSLFVLSACSDNERNKVAQRYIGQCGTLAKVDTACLLGLVEETDAISLSTRIRLIKAYARADLQASLGKTLDRAIKEAVAREKRHEVVISLGRIAVALEAGNQSKIADSVIQRARKIANGDKGSRSLLVLYEAKLAALRGDFRDAYKFANSSSSKIDRFRTIIDVAIQAHEKGKLRVARSILSQTESNAKKLRRSWRNGAFVNLARGWAYVGEWRRAIRFASKVTDRFQREGAYAAIVIALARKDHVRAALKLLPRVNKNRVFMPEVKYHLALGYIRKTMEPDYDSVMSFFTMKNAIQLAEEIEGSRRDRALAEIFSLRARHSIWRSKRHQWTSDGLKKDINFFKEKVEESVKHRGLRASAFTEIATVFREAGFPKLGDQTFEDALSSAAEAKAGNPRIHALLFIVEALNNDDR